MQDIGCNEVGGRNAACLTHGEWVVQHRTDDGRDDVGAAEIELTYNYGVAEYEIGTAFGHLALGVPDVCAVCDSVRNAGGKVTREPGPVKGGTTYIAFVQDPDGYKIELIQV